MAETLTELRLDAFVERLSSRAPTPGGGSASALAGATGAALLHMVLALTAGRRPNAPDDATLVELRAAAASWQSEMLKLVEVDAAAYEGVVAARRLSRETDTERRAHRVQVDAATREAIRVPLEIVQRAASILELAERVTAIGNRNAISDVGVAALLAGAAARGAALNAKINLPGLPDDDPLREEAPAELDRLLSEVERREVAVRRAVEEALE